MSGRAVYRRLGDCRSLTHRLFQGLPLRVLQKGNNIGEAKLIAKHDGDILKRIFFKNALYEVVAIKER